MRVFGLFKGETSYGKALRSGNAAYVEISAGSHRLTAVAEERVTGQKYAGGYLNSMEEILSAEDLEVRHIDAWAISTCCEPSERAVDSLGEWAKSLSAPLHAIGHHESHATLAFLGSGLNEALVVVSDGGGDVLDNYAGPDEWRHPREQVTYYAASRAQGLELLQRDFDRPAEVGFGEFYRAVAYFLGWPGSRFASKVMALAAYGESPEEWPDAFFEDNGRLECVIRNNPQSPLAMIDDLSKALGVDLGEPRIEGAEILEVHRSLAAYTQRQLERHQGSRVQQILRETRLKSLCLSGGVALNVVANGAIRRTGGVPTYVACAPGDDGQALGNALAVWWREARAGTLSLGDFSLRRSTSVAIGPPRRIDSASVTTALADGNHKDVAVFEYTSSAPIVAKLLSKGGTVCVFQERSEYGPRALGNRSILGDPRAKDGRALLNQVKTRDWFMPFAPAGGWGSESDALEWLARPVDSPFMSIAVQFAEGRTAELRAVASNDGTGRIQTIDPDEASYIGDVVREFRDITGVPMVLNTSFNAGGEPIVETITEALRTFMEFPINILAIGRFLLVKSLSPELIDIGLIPFRFPVTAHIVNNGVRRDLQLNRLTSRESIRAVQNSTGAVVFIRSELPLYGPYLERLREGVKRTTIRFRKGAVELPKMSELPLYETEDYGVGDRSKPTAAVRIQSLRYQIFGELTEEDALRDGFESLTHMRGDLRTIYPTLGDDEWVTIYEISLIDADAD